MLAAGSTAIASVVRGPERPAAVLGMAACALYLDARGVVAVLTDDAVRLPCAVVLPVRSDRFSLRDVPPDGFVTVGGGALRWTSGGRPVAVDVVRDWLPAVVRPVAPRADRLAELRTRVTRVDIGVPIGMADSADFLVGRGPGLTPSGDDVLAGYVLGRRAFGLPVPTVAGLDRTTALSATLLRHALAGECVPELAAVVAGLGSVRPLAPALDALLRVGHTSGAALGAGVLLAADVLIPGLPRPDGRKPSTDLTGSAGKPVFV